MTLFSIITVCYNEEKRIGKTLESIYSQTCRDFEHIIQDGKSGDRTLEIIENSMRKYDENQLKVFSEKDRGLYDAMNRAVQKTSGEYICFINSGDFLFDNNTLYNVANAIKRNPGMDWYYGKCMFVFPNGDEYAQIPTTIENPDGKDISGYLRKKRLSLIHQTIFAHRSCFENNLFDTSYKLRAELKWYYSCLLNGKKIKSMDIPVCKYSYGGISERISSIPVNARENLRIMKEYDLLSDDIRAVLPKEDDYSGGYKNIYNMWLAIHQAGLSVARYLKSINVNRIAVYGYAELGSHLVNELKKSDIDIACIIDRQDKYPYSGINVVSPENFSEEVDLIIVTAVAHYNEVFDFMNKITDCEIISLETVLENVWN